MIQASVAYWIVAAPASLLAPALALLWFSRAAALRSVRTLLAVGMAAGALVALPVRAIEGALLGWAELTPAGGGSALGSLYVFGFAAPLQMASITAVHAALWRAHRSRARGLWSRWQSAREGLALAVATASGFASAQQVPFLWRAEVWLDLARIALATLSMPALCAVWGSALGSDPDRDVRGRRFGAIWLGCTLFWGVQIELLRRGSAGALVAAAPLFVCAGAVDWALWRTPRRRIERDSGPGAWSAPAPSLDAIREAFRRQERPLTVRWVSFGALVNTGMVVAGLAAAVWTGRELGVDFGAVERPEAAAPDAVAPLLLLGCGALAAFPLAGYLLARASGTRSVLEPALSSALAMLFILLFLGVLAPPSIAFVMALAPVAFAASCAGAWFGLAR